MSTLRQVHSYMNERVSVELGDGRTGKIVRVDTFFPANDTTVTLWLLGPAGPVLVKVGLSEITGPVRQA